MVLRLLIRRKNLRLPRLRLSLLDPRLQGDTWIGACTHPHLLVMYLNNQPITLLPGSALEMASLNQILFTLRSRPARQLTTRHSPLAIQKPSTGAVSNAFENPQ